MTESRAKIEKRIANQGGYWIPTLWVFSIVVVGIGSFMLGGADAPPQLLASIQEALSDTLGKDDSSVAEIIDINEFEPNLETSDQIRIISENQNTYIETEYLIDSFEPDLVLEVEDQTIQEDTKICSLSNDNPSHEVLINEVAWAGQAQNTSGEWIELYNPQEQAVDLSGWQLQDQEGAISILFESEDQIQDFLLLKRILARDDPDTPYEVGGKQVDKVYTGVIQNSDESLYLFNQDCELVDYVQSKETNWKDIGGSASPEYKTAERKDVNSWQTYSGKGEQGIMGTPKAPNSPFVEDVSDEPDEEKIQENNEPEPSSSSSEIVYVKEIPGWCSQDDLNEPTQTVLINEVAWAGNASSTSQEWIELHTSIEGGLSLHNWQIQDQDGEIKILIDQQRIEDYLLLKRILVTENPDIDHFVGDIRADILFNGTIQNENETLRLFDASCNLVDEVIATQSNWGDIGGIASPEYKTAERIDESSWGTYVGEEAHIMGTPRAQNSLIDGSNEDQESEEDQEDGNEQDTDEGSEDNGEEQDEIPSEDDPPEEEDLSEEEDQEDGQEIEIDLEITEVIFDVEGSDEGNERIKIENNGTSTVVLEDFSIQYLKLGGDFSSVSKKNFESGNAIEDEFVIGLNCSSGIPCEDVDMSWSQALGNDGGTVFLVTNQEVIEGESDPDIHDSFLYEAEISDELLD